MARTSYYLSATSWREQVTICQQHHGEKKLLFVSNIMAKTSYYLSATSLREQVTIFLAMMLLTNSNLFSP
jgi:hypothetical protein